MVSAPTTAKCLPGLPLFTNPPTPGVSLKNTSKYSSYRQISISKSVSQGTEPGTAPHPPHVPFSCALWAAFRPSSTSAPHLLVTSAANPSKGDFHQHTSPAMCGENISITGPVSHSFLAANDQLTKKTLFGIYRHCVKIKDFQQNRVE